MWKVRVSTAIWWGHRVGEMLNPSRLRFLMVAGCLGLMWIGYLAGQPARAQDSDRKSVASSPTGTGSRAVGGSEGESAGAADADLGRNRPDEGNILTWTIRASGWIGLLIAVMSFYLIALVVWMFLHYR